jgi:hypothetical protein
MFNQYPHNFLLEIFYHGRYNESIPAILVRIQDSCLVLYVLSVGSGRSRINMQLSGY